MKRSFEWRVTSVLIAIMISLVVISKFNIYKTNCYSCDSRKISDEKIAVEISGAVAKPGVYEVRMGSPIKKILAKARPKPNANLRDIDLEAPVNASTTLEIQSLETIKVRIYFEKEFLQELEIAHSTRLSELKSKIQLPKGANLTTFKSRRLLKDGEVISLSRSNS